MTSQAHPYSVRECATAAAAAIEAHTADPAALAAALQEPIRKLIARPDLLTAGIPRQGNNVAFSRYLYFDGEMSILLFQVPKGTVIPPHDHGIWESLFVYKGRIKHTLYERADDGTTAGFAELKVVSDRVLNPGDGTVVAPPQDIHSFTALADETYGITIVNGAYKSERHYYQPERKTYEVRTQKNAR